MTSSEARRGMEAGGAGSLPRLHVVTDDAMLGRGRWEIRAAAVLEAGGPSLALHLRGPGTDGATLHRLARELLPLARRVGARLFVNDRVDVALVVGADGVHLGGRSLPLTEARRVLGPGVWLGASCHDAVKVATAREEGADYAFLGTIFATPSHPAVVGMGLEGLAASLERLRGYPVLGIGGIDPASAPSLLEAGAYGVAVMRGVWEARDPASAVRRYVDELERAVPPVGVLEQGGERR